MILYLKTDKTLQLYIQSSNHSPIHPSTDSNTLVLLSFSTHLIQLPQSLYLPLIPKDSITIIIILHAKKRGEYPILMDLLLHLPENVELEHTVVQVNEDPFDDQIITVIHLFCTVHYLITLYTQNRSYTM